MTIAFETFDTTVGGLRAALAARILAHPDWADITPTPAPATTLTVAAIASATTFTVADSTGFAVGQQVVITNSTAAYPRYVTAVAGTSVTIDAALNTASAIGATVAADVVLLKTTTTRGAQIVIDLAPSTRNGTSRVTYRMFASHPGGSYGAGIGMSDTRQVWFSAGAQAVGNVVHVTLSISKEHLFFSLEGPRPGEVGATSATYGSLRNYMFACDVVPYHDTDLTPCVASWPGGLFDASPDITEGIHRAAVSRNSTDTSNWGLCRLATVTVPNFATSQSANVPNLSTVDNRMYMWPYLVLQDDEGLRGRLASFFFIGINRTTLVFDAPANTGELFTQDGVVYKTIEVHKGDATQPAGGGFGVFSGGTAASAYWSPVVAVPFADEA